MAPIDIAALAYAKNSVRCPHCKKLRASVLILTSGKLTCSDCRRHK